MSLLERLKNVCIAPDAASAAPEGMGRAAVLIIADTSQPDLPLLFVQRSDKVSTHQNQIAFPGGRIEPGESAVEAALREAREEVGLDPTTVDVIGILPQFATAVFTRWLTPVVALRDGPFTVIPDGYEVAEWFWVSIQQLLDAPDNVRHVEYEGAQRAVHYYDVEGRIIWGVTGAIIDELLRRLRSE